MFSSLPSLLCSSLFQTTERITFRLRTTRIVRCECLFLPSLCVCVCVCVPKCILFTTSATFNILPTSHPVRHLASSLTPTSCLWLQLFRHFTSQPTSPSALSPFSFSSSPVSPPPDGFPCYRTVKRRHWIRPLKGTSMSVRTTSCRSWRRPFWERSRGWRETTCAVTAELPVSVQR